MGFGFTSSNNFCKSWNNFQSKQVKMNVPTYLRTYLPTYLPTYLRTYDVLHEEYKTKILNEPNLC